MATSFLEKAFDSAFTMYERLAGFYEEKGYFINQPSRVYRYEVLLDFAKACDGENEEIYRELLTYDLYLRENVKSRPDFCRPLTDEKYKILRRAHSGRQHAGATHIEPFSYPVWYTEELIAMKGSKKTREDLYLLFDYSKKDPLSKEAATCTVSEQEP